MGIYILASEAISCESLAFSQYNVSLRSSNYGSQPYKTFYSGTPLLRSPTYAPPKIGREVKFRILREVKVATNIFQ